MILSAALAPAAMANSIVLNQNAYSFGGGGEFQAVTSSPELLNGYAPVALFNGGFETFCVQASVSFTPGTAYSFTLSDTDSQGRALTQGAAFLYYQFATGNLAGYNYYNAASRRISAGLLQSAFWKLQGNQSVGGFPGGGPGNIFYDLALSTLGAANLAAANNGLYDVQIIQLWDAAGGMHQNQLVLNPDSPHTPGVPDGGWTLALLTLSVAGLSLMAYLIRRTPQPA